MCVCDHVYRVPVPLGASQRKGVSLWTVTQAAKVCGLQYRGTMIRIYFFGRPMKLKWEIGFLFKVV